MSISVTLTLIKLNYIFQHHAHGLLHIFYLCTANNAMQAIHFHNSIDKNRLHQHNDYDWLSKGQGHLTSCVTCMLDMKQSSYVCFLLLAWKFRYIFSVLNQRPIVVAYLRCLHYFWNWSNIHKSNPCLGRFIFGTLTWSFQKIFP